MSRSSDIVYQKLTHNNRAGVISHLRTWGALPTVLVHLIWPMNSGSEETDIAYILRRMQKQDEEETAAGAQICWVLAIDQTTTECVGGIRYSLWPHLKPDEKRPIFNMDYLPPKFEYKEYAEWAVPAYYEHRRQNARGPHAALELLWVAEAYRKAGIGGALVKQALKAFDAANLPSFVESSPSGEPLYKRNGYVEVVNEKFAIPEEFQQFSRGRTDIHCLLLRRPAMS